MSEKLTEHISFCDRKADNVRSDEFKIEILNSLREKYNIEISFKPYNLLRPTRLQCVDKHPHILSLRTVGNSYFLYLTNIDGINYCFYIDKKVDAPRHMYPRILSVNYRFDQDLFNGTLFDGELICDAEGRWYFILSDILVYKDQILTNRTITTKMELIYFVLQNNYAQDMVMDICPFQVKKLFTYKDIEYMLKNYIPNLPYNTKGICFNTMNPQYSSYIYMFNQTERIPSKYRKQKPTIDKSLTKSKTTDVQQTHVFKIIETSTSQIYDLYCTNKGKTMKYGVAYIGDASHRQFVNHLFETAPSKVNIMVECYYAARHRKWKPVAKSSNKEPDEFDNIKITVNKYNK
jgi:hypothetical protein